ncbi:efflux RND transporter periplasmic adaptor subunit [Sinorhizobium numidicum]|uniref:Efflux RND transporter periplasmic adaptor subunit n=1 Tax=Sinorhizobium numidicum TaxID=680248 RepID=A0ABY8CZN0_9HYPH|nr:efflux RND transporter periplasmic adaptor subunit [Sinorhizobium numidicum]WEX78995.1 efflux RND transporter periplasmic adaptor subunit [Sinorhizobium numidicum]WEX82391.1 efflux RND transporter periplasmic adaptor subunit [Sinorhizobium numidicum]
MKTFKFLFLVSSLAVAGGGGYVAGTRGLATNFDQLFSGRALGETVPPAPMPTGKVIYYRHPDGTPEYSATPRETPDGRAFVAVRQSEDVSFEPVKPASEEAQAAPATGERKILYYRNPMGLPDTSKVPKKDSMGMDYIPVYEGNEADGSVVKVSLGKLQRTGVKTATAERTVVARKVRVPGTIAFDERLVRIVSMRADAFIEGVADVTTGDRVRKGGGLFHFYSKEIAKAGAEYATELRAGGKPGLDVGGALQLRNLGVPEETIRAMAKDRAVPKSVPYLSPSDGVVLERNATTGMMAEAGDVLFRIADTSRIWVIADVPEYDAAAIRKGAAATVRVRNLPGRPFKATVDLIYPEIQAQTRTTRVRIELPNAEGLFLANMYVEVEVASGDPAPVVAVPNSAVIDTGDRQIVFVDKGEGRFEPRDVALGARGDDRTEITKGIEAGEKIVVSANFLLDAESNLNAALNALTASEAQP